MAGDGEGEVIQPSLVGHPTTFTDTKGDVRAADAARHFEQWELGWD